jgi:glycosyltransferase involved in cell wall biosynthesis
MAMDVSFLVPAYNAEATIVFALRSILAQDARGVGWEVIVIDDGSTDSTRELVRDFMGRNPSARIELLEEKHRGEAAALNRGLNRVSGDYVALVESDVVLASDWLRLCLGALQENGVAGAGGYLRDARGAPWIARLAAIEVEAKLADQPHYAAHISSANALYHSWAFERVGRFREGLYNATFDSDFNARLLKSGCRLRFVREAQATHAYKRSLAAYLIRFYWYGRFRPHVRQGFLYPADRWVALLVVLTAVAYASLGLISWSPWVTAAAWASSLGFNALWTLRLALLHPDRALWCYPLILLLRNSVALVGILVGLLPWRTGSHEDLS